MSHPARRQERMAPRPRPPLLLSLEPYLVCPDRRCNSPVRTRSDLLIHTCENKKCRAHWWATRLEAGDIRSQVRSAFDGNEEFVELLDLLGAPERIDRPLYWQIWLSGGDLHHTESFPGLVAQSHALIRRLVGLLRVGR